MSTSFWDRTIASIQKRKEQNRFRTLPQNSFSIDFSSNDYLGLSRSAWIQQALEKKLAEHTISHGATGSRLLSGNSPIISALEEKIAQFHHAEAALLYNSGFDANSGLLSAVIREKDVVFADEAIHASLHWGIKLSRAKCFLFKHNDVGQLEDLLKEHKGEVSWIITESYFSMDGDKAPLDTIARLSELYNACLIVDEAHAVGVFGQQGRGLAESFGIEEKCTARVVTYGKAMGCHGAAVLCSEMLKSYLINFSKPFIYSTALPLHSILNIDTAYDFINRFSAPQKQLHDNIRYLISLVKAPQLNGEGPVFSWKVNGEAAVKALAAQLQNKDMDVRAIVAPTVTPGSEMLRINIHSFNTQAELKLLAEMLLATV